MSKYTTEVRFICESYAGLEESEGLSNVSSILTTAAPLVFDFSFPIFDETYRLPLERSILRHYYTREIGFETVGRWKLALEDRLNLIMPYYNKLYETELLQFNPLYDTDYTKTGERDGTSEGSATVNSETTNAHTNEISGNTTTETDITTNGSVSNTGTATGSSTDGGSESNSGTNTQKYTEWNLYSDTPQGGTAGILGAEDSPSVGDNSYLTNARKIDHDGTGTNSTSTTTFGKTNSTTANTTESGTTQETREGSVTGTSATDESYSGTTNFESQSGTNVTTGEEYSEHVMGKMPGRTYASMLKEFRTTFLNIDKMLIEELSDLFMNLW